MPPNFQHMDFSKQSVACQQFFLSIIIFYVIIFKYGGLAQLVRASASHAEGQRFESAALHQKRHRKVSFFYYSGREPGFDKRRPKSAREAQRDWQGGTYARERSESQSAALHQKKDTGRCLFLFIFSFSGGPDAFCGGRESRAARPDRGSLPRKRARGSDRKRS